MMKKYTKRILIIFLAIFSFTADLALAAEIAIIKSNDISPYNQAINGLKQEVNANFREYDLQGKPETFPKILRDISRKPPELIFTLGALATVKAKENITDIPIIYTLVLNPTSKNLTGKNTIGISIEVSVDEQLSTFKRVVPKIKKIGVLYSQLTENLIAKAEKSCRALGLELVAIKLKRPEDVPNGMKKLLSEVDSLWLLPDSIVVDRDSLHYILLLTLENHIPFMVYNHSFVKAGALLSPVVNYTNIGRQAGKIARQILKGEKPSATILPPEGFEWAINLHIAQSMGLEVQDHTLRLFKHVYK